MLKYQHFFIWNCHTIVTISSKGTLRSEENEFVLLHEARKTTEKKINKIIISYDNMSEDISL